MRRSASSWRKLSTWGQSAGGAANPGGLVPFAWPGQAAGTGSVSSHLSFAVTDLIFARDRSQRNKIQDRE
jgi:hypothetical protein